jgi:MFS family permease
LVIALGPTEIWFWIGMTMVGVASAMNGPAVAAYSAEAAPRHAYGPAMGLLRSFGDIGFILGPILVGLLDDLGSAGTRGGIMANAVLLFVCTLAFAIIAARTHRARVAQRAPVGIEPNDPV